MDGAKLDDIVLLTTAQTSETIEVSGDAPPPVAGAAKLDRTELQRVPGYLLAFTGLKIAIAIEWRSGLPAAELRERILGFVRNQPEPELADIVIVAGHADMDEARMPPHARAYARTLLSA